MIRPDRHTNLKYSIINISSVILSELNAFYAVKYDVLMQKVLNALGDDARINFPYALNFLYLIDKISYEQTTDSFKSTS